jgi:hypothetical protein
MRTKGSIHFSGVHTILSPSSGVDLPGALICFGLFG